MKDAPPQSSLSIEDCPTQPKGQNKTSGGHFDTVVSAIVFSRNIYFISALGVAVLGGCAFGYFLISASCQNCFNREWKDWIFSISVLFFFLLGLIFLRMVGKFSKVLIKIRLAEKTHLMLDLNKASGSYDHQVAIEKCLKTINEKGYASEGLRPCELNDIVSTLRKISCDEHDAIFKTKTITSAISSVQEAVDEL